MDQEQGTVLTREQVEAMLEANDEGVVHTFVQSGNMLLGADSHTVEDILAFAEAGQCKRAGPAASTMRHAIVVHRTGGPDLFVSTKERE